MKAEAYICDKCNTLLISDEVVGVALQEDLFERMLSFPVINDPAKAMVHVCVKCYDMNVTQVAGREFNKKFDERGYELKLREMSYMLRSQCVANYNKKFHKKVAKKK